MIECNIVPAFIMSMNPIKRWLKLGSPWNRKYDKKIQVEVTPLIRFDLAEDYHQDYLKKNPNGYCHIDLSLADEPLIDETAYPKPSDSAIKGMLTEEQYNVTQYSGTEKPFTNAYWNTFDDGIYVISSPENRAFRWINLISIAAGPASQNLFPMKWSTITPIHPMGWSEPKSAAAAAILIWDMFLMIWPAESGTAILHQ